MTAAVAEVAAPPPPEVSERTRQLEEKVIALTAELKAANDKCGCKTLLSSSIAIVAADRWLIFAYFWATCASWHYLAYSTVCW